MSTSSSPSQTPSPKKATKMKNDKVKISAKVKKSTHPPTSVMVTAAINELNERKGSSLPAIKKYIAGNYEVDAEKLAPFIKKHIKKAVEAGDLIQTSGRGANGSFKFPPKSKPKKKKAAVAAPKEESGESENDSQSQSESEDKKEDTPPKVTTSRPRKQLPTLNEKSITKKETKANSKELKKSKTAEPTKEKTTAVKSLKKSKSKSPKKQAKY